MANSMSLRRQHRWDVATVVYRHIDHKSRKDRDRINAQGREWAAGADGVGGVR